MTIDAYNNAFTDKMEFDLCVVPDELAKIERYSKGLPWEYSVSIKQALNFEAAIWATRSMESMIKKRTANRSEVGEKRKVDGSSGNNNSKKKKNFSK